MVIFTQTVGESINEQVDLFSLFRVFASYCPQDNIPERTA